MTAARELLRLLWPDGDGTGRPQVHALIDGARDDTLVPQLALSRLPHECLYAGTLSPDLRLAAPWLVHLAPESAFVETLLSSGWGRAWGVFVVARPDVTTQALRRHFRTLLRVDDEDGRKLAFRYYDPRVLRAYLPTCRPTELRRMLGPVDRLVVESANGEPLVFTLARVPSADERATPADLRTLTIRHAQMAVLRADVAAAFPQQLAGRLRERHGQALAPLDDAALLRVVEAGCARAGRWGLSERADRAAFVALMLEVAPDFDGHPAVRAVLRDVSMAPSTRLLLLPRLVPDHAWRAMARPLDAAALLRWLEGRAAP